MPTRVVWVKNNFAAAKLQLQRELEKRVGLAANDLRGEIRAALEEGRFRLGSDTGALAASLYVQTAQGSDYANALNTAAARYLSEDSRWMEWVRAKVEPDAYEKSHFAERVAPEEALTQEQGKARAAVATMLAYGVLWEQGHYNRLTERDESPRHWMSQTAMDWQFAKLADFFRELI